MPRPAHYRTALNRTALKSGLALLCLVALTACGADGLPTAPAAKTVPPSGVAVTGEARIGATTSF